MLLPIQIKTDWARIRQRKQDMINVNNRKENAKRIEHENRVGEKVLLEKPGLVSKLSAPHTGPYRITHTYTNGTPVRIQCGVVNERVNIRRLTPYKERALAAQLGKRVHYTAPCITFSVAIQKTKT